MHPFVVRQPEPVDSVVIDVNKLGTVRIAGLGGGFFPQPFVRLARDP